MDRSIAASAGPSSPHSLIANQAPTLNRLSSSCTTSLPVNSPTISRTASSSTGNFERTTVKRRARNLLRDYYGLHGQQDNAAGRDPLNVDSPTFDAKAYFSSLNSQSLPELLKRENDLLTEIRELDSERQSLVYNHHHELIEASDTIRKMKARAESLDADLDQLRSSFETITQLSTSLSSAPLPALSQVSNASQSGETPVFEPVVHLPPLLDLPQTLRALLTASSNSGASQSAKRTEADLLWGSWEPALRSWEEAGVKGVKEVATECRETLARGRRPSLSLNST